MITEPTTLATDYLLGALTGALAWRLGRQNRVHHQTAIALWAAALAATAVASLTGGTYHGFGPGMPPGAAATLWTATTLAMGAASAFLAAAVVWAAFTATLRRMLVVGVVVELTAYSWWMLHHEAFVYVICQYGSALLVVLALVAVNRVRGAAGHRAYLVAGIVVSMVAAGLQQSGIRIHAHFNHNDLMHVVQMGAMWLLYEGGRRLRDADGRK